MRRHGLSPLSEVINRSLGQLESQAGTEVRAVMLWPEIVGEQVARASEAQSLRGGVLAVTVRDAVWNNQIALLKGDILAGYRRRLGRDIVRDVQCRVGRLRGLPPVAAPAGREAEIARIQLPPEEVETIRQASENADPELSQAVRRALTREAQFRRWHLANGARSCAHCGAAYRGLETECPACRRDRVAEG
jgi:hypothetical protein